MAQDWRAPMNEWLADHSGIITAKTLNELGCPPREWYRLVERDELSIILPGTFRSRHWPLEPIQLMTAACLRCPQAALGFVTAGRWWSFRRLPPDDRIHVLVPHGCSPVLDGVVVHRCRQIDNVDIVRRDDGITLTSPVRTLFDCADMLGKEATASVLEQLIDRGNGSFVTHAATLARLGRPRRPGTRTMARVIASRPAWRQAMQSDLEARVLAEIVAQGLPTPGVQLTVLLPDGSRIRLDFAWPDHRVALEVDHPFWHAGSEESHRDKRRDRKLLSINWRVMRITDLDVGAALTESIADVAAVLRLVGAVS